MMYYIFNQSGDCIATCDFEPNLEDLASRNEQAIKSEQTFGHPMLVDGEIVDVSPQPSQYHQLVDGQWIVSEKYKANLIKEKAKNLIDYLANKTDQLKSSLLVGYPQTEIDSFYRQEKEALAWRDDHNTPTPMLTQIAKLRGVPFELLVDKVLEKSNQFAFVIGVIIGKRQHFEDDILKAETLEQLVEIEQEIEKWTL